MVSTRINNTILQLWWELITVDAPHPRAVHGRVGHNGGQVGRQLFRGLSLLAGLDLHSSKHIVVWHARWSWGENTDNVRTA